MTNIMVEFKGICTNFQAVDPPNGILPPGVADRIVLVNADAGRIIDEHEIPPHYAWLQLPTGPSLRLEGCALAIANSIQIEPISYMPSYTGIVPNLTTLMGGTLGPPSQAVIAGNDPSLASCYFDFVSGTFYGCVIPNPDPRMNAAQTRVVVETDGDPVLTLTPFPGSPMPPATFRPPSGSVLTIVHSAENETDDEMYHFLLSYLTAAVMPAAPVLPQDILGDPCTSLTQLVSVACSNSTYP